MKNEYHYDIIRKPVMTEKSTLAQEYNKVVFDVSIKASKTDIKAAIENLFKVKVKHVNTLTRKGKEKRFRQTKGRQSNVKKAIITLDEGHTIDIASGL